MKFNKETFLEKCNSLYDLYTERTSSIPPVRGCMLKAEGFCFCVLCDIFDIDIVIESGLLYGASTEMFAKYFSKEKKIYPVDKEVLTPTREKLSQYKNIEIIEGDSLELVEKIIEENNGSKIAVFIDGPKDEGQLALAKEIVESVEFVALHDVGKNYIDWYKRLRGALGVEYDPISETHENFMNWENSVFITTEDWYAEKYSHMNHVQLGWLKGETTTGWPKRNDGYDSELNNLLLSSITPKGFGLGIAMKKEYL